MTHISKIFVTFSGKEFLPLNTTRVAEKFFPPKNLVYGFWRENFFLLFSSFPLYLFHRPFTILASTTAPTSRRSCSSRCQMSLLLPADHGTRWTRTTELWVLGRRLIH